MRFPNGCISLFLCAISLFSGIAESGESSDFLPRITKQRVVSCPLKLDTRGMDSEEGRKSYYWQQALAEFPFQQMSNAVGLHTNIESDQVLTSNGGYFAVNDDRNSVYQLYCTYTDANGRPAHLAFSFRDDVKFHITGHLPTTADEIIFPNSGKKSCSAINELPTPETPHCRSTLVSLIITNQIKVASVDGVSANPNLYGSISYKSTMDIPEFTGEPEVFDEENRKKLVKPGETRYKPISLAPNHHGINAGVIVYEELDDITELCINRWLPKAHLLVKYGASPHLLITGEVGTDGNIREHFQCELRCNEKERQRDCWDVWFYEKLGYYFTWGGRSDLRRSYMLAKVNKAYEADFSGVSDDVLLNKYQAIDFYEALELKPDASTAEIKNAYRTLSKVYHPDKNIGLHSDKKKENEEKLRMVQNAYKRLGKLIKFAHEEL